MPEFSSPTDLKHNRGLITDPVAFAEETGAASWLFLCGEEFASMEGGMSYADVQSAVPESVNLVADPPRPFDMDVARRGVEALDSLPRPTLVTCRTGPRSSALVYLYSGLRSGASAEDVLARAKADGAPFIEADPLKEWVVQGLSELENRDQGAAGSPPAGPADRSADHHQAGAHPRCRYALGRSSKVC
jgi:hypothetical protein